MMHSLFIPVVAMVLLTILIWLLMYYRRINEILSSKINPQLLATSSGAMRQLKNVSAADNFKNLFEMPILFYVICIILEFSGNATSIYLTLAWCYVVLRYLHSFIHVTYNRVMHRYYVYISSCAVLFSMWGLFVMKLFESQ